MNLLLDTHVLLWSLSDPSQLSARARAAIADGSNAVFVSSVSVWEIAIKRELGKLQCPDDLLAEVATHRFEVLPVSEEHAWSAGALEPIHRDPFDRMLIAQAIAEKLTIVTRDGNIPAYGLAVLET